MPTGVYKRTPEILNKIHKFKCGNVPWNKGKPMSGEHKEKIRKANLNQTPERRLLNSIKNTGERNHNWQGGKTDIGIRIRQTAKYKQWRTAVFTRDNYTCVWCKKGNRNGERTVLQADHIKPFSLFPELRFELSNGRTLCIPCHRKTDTYGIKIIKNK